MKRFVGTFVVLALVGSFAACSSSSNNNDGDVIITPDVVSDAKDNGKDTVATDLGKDQSTTENVGVDNPPPPDNGVDVPVVSDPGTDPGTDVPVTCFDDPNGSCKAVYACMGDCNADTSGDACRQECQSKLSARGQQDFQTFNTCLQQNCSSAKTNDEFYACIDSKCINQYYGCFWGCQYEKCPALVGCLTSCPADNPATTDVDERNVCLGNCWGGGTTEAQVDLQSAINCTNTACPVCSVANPTPTQETECNDCWDTATSGTCASNWDKCTAYGTKTCAEMFTCVNGCQDTACTQACLQSGTKTGGTLWNAMINCASDTCTASCPDNPTPEQNTACNDCFNAAINQGGACADKMTACQNDTAAQ